MAAPAKFLFDTDFAAPDKARERAATAAEVAQKIAEAEARAYRAGYEAAQHEARVESDRRAALALEEIGITIRGIATRFSGIEARMETEAVEVAVALKGASEAVRQFFLSNMSTRAAKMLVDDMQAMGPVRLRDVDEAQVLLVNLAKDLAAKGEIVISKTRGEEELIY